jgi:ATP-dependent DNA ligase
MRGDYWVKTTCANRETLAMAGFNIKDNRFDGIYLCRLHGGKLIYAGKVEHGFESPAAKELQRRLKPLARKTQPFAKRISNPESGSSRSWRPRSSTVPNRPTGTCRIHSSKACWRISEHGAPLPG